MEGERRFSPLSHPFPNPSRPFPSRFPPGNSSGCGMFGSALSAGAKMSKVCRSRRSRATSLTPTPPLAALLEGNVGFCFVLLVFLGCFFPPSPSQTPDGALSPAGKLLRVSKWERWGRASARLEQRLGLNPLYLGLTQALKPLIWGVKTSSLGLSAPNSGCVRRRDPTALPSPWKILHGLAPGVGGIYFFPWVLHPGRRHEPGSPQGKGN